MEIDAISQRLNHAESSFLTVYSEIIELPDPVPLVARAIKLTERAQLITVIQAENEKLKQELNEFHKLTPFPSSKLATFPDYALPPPSHQQNHQLDTAEAEHEIRHMEHQRISALHQQRIQDLEHQLVRSDAAVSTLRQKADVAEKRVLDMQTQSVRSLDAKTMEGTGGFILTRPVELLWRDAKNMEEKVRLLASENAKLHAEVAGKSTQDDIQRSSLQTNSRAANSQTLESLSRLQQLQSEMDEKSQELNRVVEEVARVQTERDSNRDAFESQLTILQNALKEATDDLEVFKVFAPAFGVLIFARIMNLAWTWRNTPLTFLHNKRCFLCCIRRPSAWSQLALNCERKI